MNFIIGANGWLGLNLASMLARSGATDLGVPPTGVRGLILTGSDREALYKAAPALSIAEGDLRTGAGLDDFLRDGAGGTLIHTAGVIHPKRVRDFYTINVEGVRKILDAALRARLKRVVIVSSNSPCGFNPHREHRFDESSPYHPYMNYGRSKMQMEMMVHAYQKRGQLETVLVRAPWFYGPFQPPRQVLFFEMIRDGKGPIVGDGENLRSMAYTENLAEGLIQCATRANSGETYWIADERPYTMNEIIDTIERLLEEEFGQKCAHRRMRLPGLVSEVAWGIDALVQSLGLYHQKIHVLSEMNKTIVCTIDKAKRDFGYRPRISLEEGMRRSLAECFSRT